MTKKNKPTTDKPASSPDNSPDNSPGGASGQPGERQAGENVKKEPSSPASKSDAVRAGETAFQKRLRIMEEITERAYQEAILNLANPRSKRRRRDERHDELHASQDYHRDEHAAGHSTELSAEQRQTEAPKKPRGRPRLLDATAKTRICAFIEAGLSMRQAAAQVGCHHSTISREMARDPKFSDQVEFAERRGAVQPLVQMIRASKRSWRAAAWLMKNHRPSLRVRREEEEENDHESAVSMRRMMDLMDDSGGGSYNVRSR